MQIKKYIRKLLYNALILPVRHWQHKNRIKRIKKNGHADVVFLCMNLAMWRYEGVLRHMLDDQRFRCHVIFGTFISLSEQETQSNFKTLQEHFAAQNIHLINSTTPEGMDEALLVMKDADIIFYPQPYGKLFCNKLDNKYYRERLLCYIPYAFFTATADWAYNTALHNQAWRLYRESDLHLSEAQQMAINKGKNIVVVGNIKAEEFYNNHSSQSVWKEQPTPKKRIIWGPHFSIEPNSPMGRNGFLWLSEIMPKLAEQYADKVQIAFKPHPKLFSTLCHLDGWGKERAQQYYDMWCNMDNGQCDLGDYVTLFKQSDAIIHDSGSFTIDYLYTGKPAMFVTSDIKDVKSRLNKIACLALEQYYIGTCQDDVVRFIEDVVLGGNDEKKAAREDFRDHYLLSSNGKDVSLAVYNDIVSNVFG